MQLFSERSYAIAFDLLGCTVRTMAVAPRHPAGAAFPARQWRKDAG
jgi:hypothetical protein